MTVILPPFLSFLDWKFGALGNRMRAVTYSISLKPAVLILILKLHTVFLGLVSCKLGYWKEYQRIGKWGPIQLLEPVDLMFRQRWVGDLPPALQRQK